jgi:hypothetical protein
MSTRRKFRALGRHFSTRTMSTRLTMAADAYPTDDAPNMLKAPPPASINIMTILNDPPITPSAMML